MKSFAKKLAFSSSSSSSSVNSNNTPKTPSSSGTSPQASSHKKNSSAEQHSSGASTLSSPSSSSSSSSAAADKASKRKSSVIRSVRDAMRPHSSSHRHSVASAAALSRNQSDISSSTGGSNASSEQPITTPEQRKKGQKTFRKPQDLEKLSLLGEGSFGSVYLVRNRATGALHALKVMKLDNDSSASQIMKEIDILHQANSKYIVRYDGYYLEKNCLSILMEYCSGGSLQEMMAALERPFTEIEVACCIRSLLKALEALHKSKKIHRDIKSGNVLMSDEGRVKLADFGVSRELMNTSSLANTVIGTVLWMAPEVIEGTKYSFPADIWSVGITTIELAEGRPPLSNVPNMRALFLIPQRPSPTLAHPEQFSDDLNDFLAQCLQKNPDERPTASALLKHSFLRTKAKKSKKVLSALLDEINQRYQEAGGKEEYFRKLKAKYNKKKQKDTTDTLNTDTLASSDESSSDEDEDGTGANYDTMIMNSNTQTYADDETLSDSDDSSTSSETDGYGTVVIHKTPTASSTLSREILKGPGVNAGEDKENTISQDQIDLFCSEFRNLSSDEIQEKLGGLDSEMKQEIEELKDSYEVRRKAILQIRYQKEKESKDAGSSDGSFGRTPPTLPSRTSKPDLGKILRNVQQFDDAK